jgi:energy-coupling factor transporter ATP-binding protein EcfA2
MSINVKINQKFKSVDVCEFELPKFCVLTGKNGSGKTHILEAMANIVLTTQRQQVPSLNNSNVTYKSIQCKFVKLVLFGQLNPTIAEKCDPDEINKFIKNVFAFQGNPNSITQPTRTQYKDFISYVRSQINQSGEIGLVSENDLRNYFDVIFMGTDDLLAGKFSLIFKNYSRIKDINLYNRFKRDQGYSMSITADVLLDEEFIERYGIPPWDFVNQIFERVNIPYLVNNPESDDRDSTFDLELRDKGKQDVHIKCADLSTGEKVLMSLAMAIYNSDTNCQKPDLLLIDEPDAGLHPSMSKNMVSVLHEFIVEKLDIPVVITTHSPTTIAALDGVEIYEKERNVDVPKKISKEHALSLLTSDIPFLTVSMEKRRAVFVESEYDAQIYSELREIYKDEIPCVPLFFALRKDKSSGNNCVDVINQAKNFKNCGNTNVFGIIDWDNIKNRKTEDNLLVLGNSERYAIENYILDPLLIGIFLIVNRDKSFSDFGVTSLKNYSEITKITNQDAQLILNGILNLIGVITDEKRSYRLVSKWTLETCEQIFTMRGHVLEELYKNKIPSLGTYNNDAQKNKNLKLQIIDAVIKVFPNFISQAVLDTLKLLK